MALDFTESKKPVAAAAPVKKVKPAAAAKKTKGPKKPRKPVTEIFGMKDQKEALFCAPKEYIDCTQFNNSFANVPEEVPTMFQIKLTGVIKGYNANKKLVWSIPDRFSSVKALPRQFQFQTRRVEVEVVDQRGYPATISTFRGIGEWRDAEAGMTKHIVGSYKQFGSKLYLNIESEVPADAIGSIWVKYSNESALASSERVREAVESAKALDDSWRFCAGLIIGECALDEAALIAKIDAPFPNVTSILKNLHKPESVNEGEAALECARKLSAIAMQTRALQQTARNTHPKSPVLINQSTVDRMRVSQKEKLTDDQENVIRRTCELMAQPKAMFALLSGDVGTGKTLTYLIPAIAVHQAGGQVAIMAPTQLLADQIYQQLLGRFGSEVKGVQRIEAGDKIKDPSYILVGTSALVGASTKSSWVPNLLILDEQHKMSSSVKEDMVGPWTHVMQVSATPIPRSLATALYDGMEILNLRQSPVKKQIFSHVADMSSRSEMLRTLRNAIAKGERCAIVYPDINVIDSDSEEDDEEAEEKFSVEKAFASFDAAFPGKVVMLHGKMDQDEIRGNITKMREGRAQLMIASTVVETGIDIPSISVMIVRNADRFGISQLHQLRGRLVRNGGAGDFIMAVEDLESVAEDTLARLNAIAATTDGYELAERDLLQRGMGDFGGEDQSGKSRTLFRQIKLGVGDFMNRKLRSLRVEALDMPASNTENRQSRSPQQSLI